MGTFRMFTLSPQIRKSVKNRYAIALACIVVLICGLLKLNYNSHRSLQQAGMERLHGEFNSRVELIHYFLEERKNDIQDLATDRHVTGFFVNKALGMTMAYGLEASLNNIGRLFARTDDQSQLAEKSIYSRLLLLDPNGSVLSTWPDDGRSQDQTFPLEITPDSPSTIISSSTPGMLLIASPVMVNNTVQGYVQGWVSYETMLAHLMGKTQAMVLITDHQRLVFQQPAQIALHPRIIVKLNAIIPGQPLSVRQEDLLQSGTEDKNRKSAWILFGADIPDYGITLYQAQDSSDIVQQLPFYLFMAVLVLLSGGVVLVSAFILKTNMQSLVLATSLAETQKREQAVAEKKDELELIIDGARLGTWNWNIISGEMEFNARWAEMLGYELHELKGNVDTWKELVHPDDMALIMPILQAHLRGETPAYSVEHRLRHKSGKWIWVLDTGKVMQRDDKGEPLHAFGIHLDISEQKAAQHQISKAKEESDSIIRNFLDSLIVIRTDLTIARVNQATCALLGYREEELVNGPVTMLFQDRPELIQDIFSFYKEKGANNDNSQLELRNVELTYLTKAGGALPISINISLLTDDDNAIIGVVAGAKDISKLKATLDQVARQKEYIEYLFEIVPQGLLTLDPTLKITKRNREFSAIIRNLAEQWQLPEEKIAHDIHEKLTTLLPHTNNGTFALSHLKNVAHFRFSAAPVPQFADIEYVVAISDITHERKQEAARRLLATVIEQTADSIVLTDPEGIIRYANPAAVTNSGWSADELIGQPARIFKSGLTSPAVYQELWQTILQGDVWSGHLSNRKKDGPVIEEDVTISPVRNEEGELSHFVAIKRDVTDLTRLQRQLLQAQKMEAVGQLAAGIAHEINTPMQYVRNNVTFFARAFGEVSLLLADYKHLQQQEPGLELAEDAAKRLKNNKIDFLMEEIPESIDEIEDGINRVVKIISAMKEFSHPGTGEKVAIDLNRAVESTITVARNEWKYVAEMVTDFDPDLPMVVCLPDQITQAVLNLIVNSAHAIKETGAGISGDLGRITISTRQDKDWAELQVSDTGAGIAKENHNRIFEPFFTTKEVGKGTGQGLAITHDAIVNKHGGTIDFTSEPGKGTTFTIRLPIVPPSAGAAS